MIVPVILNGGAGTRLWPLSTDSAPKQFLPLVGKESTFKAVVGRVRQRTTFAAPIIVGSERQAGLCEQALTDEATEARLILEPIARNTAAAIVMAAVVARELHGGSALLLVMPSDHVIVEQEQFSAAVASGVPAANIGRLVTLGIKPTRPETGYGYIQIGSEIPDAPGVREAVRFVEKPQSNVAETMVASQEYLWNAGIFLFRADTLIEEVQQIAPEIAAAAEGAVLMGRGEGRLIYPDPAALEDCPSQSIDYAVMERSRRVAVVPADFGWTDLGSWDAIADLEEGRGPVGPVTTVDCEGCYIRSDGIEIAALGLHDVIMVASGKRLLVVPRGRSQEVKRLLAAMESKKTKPRAGSELSSASDAVLGNA